MHCGRCACKQHAFIDYRKLSNTFSEMKNKIRTEPLKRNRFIFQWIKDEVHTERLVTISMLLTFVFVIEVSISLD